MSNRVIGVSPENYNSLNELRREIQGEKKYETFDAVITRLLGKEKKHE